MSVPRAVQALLSSFLFLVLFALFAAAAARAESAPPPGAPPPAERGFLDRVKSTYQGISGAVTEKIDGLESSVKIIGEQLAAVGRLVKAIFDLVFFIGFKLLVLLTLTAIMSLLLSSTGLLQGRAAFLGGFAVAAFAFHELSLLLTAGKSGGYTTLFYGGVIAALPVALSAGTRAAARLWQRRRLARAFSPVDLTTEQALREWLFGFEQRAAEISRLGHSVLAATPAERASLQLELIAKVRCALGPRAEPGGPA